MNEDIKKKILKKIEEYQTIIVSRHIRPDGDAIGSTKGLVKLLIISVSLKRVCFLKASFVV